MSEHWTYEVWLPAPKALTAIQIRHILELASELGYIPRQFNHFPPPDEGMVVESMDGIDDVIEILHSTGGLLTLGKASLESWDTAIEISFASINSHDDAPNSSCVHTRLYDELKLYVDDYRYRDDEGSYDRVALSKDVQHLYCDLCTYFDARYGAVWSNYDYEEIILDLHRALYDYPKLSWNQSPDKSTFQPLMDGVRFDAEVRDSQPPSALFCVQYFSLEYAERLDLEVCVSLGGKLTPLPKGVLLSFFDYPWEVDWRRLLAINEEWRMLNPSTLRP